MIKTHGLRLNNKCIGLWKKGQTLTHFLSEQREACSEIPGAFCQQSVSEKRGKKEREIRSLQTKEGIR